MLAYKTWNLVWVCGYCVQSRKCHVRYNSHSLMRRVTCAASSLPRVCSVAVTWITRCCLLNLLTFGEFEWVMRAVKKYFGNTKTLGNNLLKLRTNMHLIDDPWRKYTASVSARNVIKLQLVNKNVLVWSILYNPPSFSKCTRALIISSSTVFVPFSCGCYWFTETTATQQKFERLFSFENVSPEILRYLINFSLQIVLSA